MSIHPFEIDPETSIASLCGSLDRADREPFRQAAYAALAAVPCLGEGAIYRVLVATWRNFFRPPDVAHDTGRHADRRAKAMRAAEPIADDRKRR